jgi:hypothetical protein
MVQQITRCGVTVLIYKSPTPVPRFQNKHQ